MSAPNHPGKLGQLKMKIDFTIADKVRRYADVWVTPGKREYHSKDDDQESGCKKCLLKAKARARGAMLHLRVFESRDHKGEPIVVCSPAEDGDDGDGGDDQDGLVRIKQSATPQPPQKNMRIKLTNVNKKNAGNCFLQ